MKRYISKSDIHKRAVEIGRARLEETANRLAAADVGEHIDSLLDAMKGSAWELPDATIIEGVAGRLWQDWCTVELRSELRKS